MSEKFTGLILAAPRKQGENPLSMIEDVSHKCLVKANGVTMLERVIQSLLGADNVKRVLISIDDAAVIDRIPALASLRREGRIEAVQSQDNLYASIAHVAEKCGDIFPLFVTTADNALQTPQIVDHFLETLSAAKAEVAFGMTPISVIETAYPETVSTPMQVHALRDGGYTTCNLYALTNDRALRAAEVMRGGGQFRKRNWRILKAFGLFNLIGYRYKLYSLQGLARAASRRFKLNVVAVSMPFADAGVDADKESSFNFVDQALKKRESAGGAVG